MSVPRRARIDWKGHPAWLTLFPNGVALALLDDLLVYVPGLPCIWQPWTQAEFEQAGGKIIEWLDGE